MKWGSGTSTLQTTGAELAMSVVLEPCATTLMALGAEGHTEVQHHPPLGSIILDPPLGSRKSVLRAANLKNANLSLSPGEEKPEHNLDKSLVVCAVKMREETVQKNVHSSKRLKP